MRFNMDTTFKDFPHDLLKVDNGKLEEHKSSRVIGFVLIFWLVTFWENSRKTLVKKEEMQRKLLTIQLIFMRKASLTIEVWTLIEYLAGLSFRGNRNKDFSFCLTEKWELPNLVSKEKPIKYIRQEEKFNFLSDLLSPSLSLSQRKQNKSARWHLTKRRCRLSEMHVRKLEMSFCRLFRNKRKMICGVEVCEAGVCWLAGNFQTI